MSDASSAKAERRGIGIARLKLEAGPVDGATIETRWGASLKPAAAQAELLQGFAQEDRSRFTRTSRRILLLAAVDQTVEKSSRGDDDSLSSDSAAIAETDAEDSAAVVWRIVGRWLFVVCENLSG